MTLNENQQRTFMYVQLGQLATFLSTTLASYFLSFCRQLAILPNFMQLPSFFPCVASQLTFFLYVASYLSTLFSDTSRTSTHQLAIVFLQLQYLAILSNFLQLPSTFISMFTQLGSQLCMQLGACRAPHALAS